MDKFELDDSVAPKPQADESPLKDWRLKYQAGTIQKTDFIEFFKREARKYYDCQYERDSDTTRPSLKCNFREKDAQKGIISVLLEFILGDNPNLVLSKLKQEGVTASICGKVFKNGEPTYSCRQCGMDPTCVLCVNCFKQSAHRYHKYRMSTSGGGGCCDCGDEEAWKKDPYCEEHLRGKENPAESSIITDAIKERCEIAFTAILAFCVKFLEIETNASLECLDGDGEVDDYFCTVLYNDESHTFEQVIQTLTKIVKCKDRDASEIVSSIDREGRAVVKCDTFHECTNLKDAIEKQSVTFNIAIPINRSQQSLRVSVLHIRAVACQQFALQLLTWFQEFLIKHYTFRQIFAKVILDKKAPFSIRHILEYDVKLWKTARTSWHRLLISGMLMEYDNKMALAQEFSRHYATIMQEFISDDHDHSFSIVSLSVQLFTVPSIAHYLIANEGIFHKLLHTFYHEAVEKYVQNKTLHFSKNMSSLTFFKRAAYILYDLKYILSFKPDAWTTDLREGFLEGCKSLLRLMQAMQGMEATTRQTGQHMDYEPEWECAFNLHIKLATAITLVIEWAASDRDVLVKLYTFVMRYLAQSTFIIANSTREERKVGDHVANCIIYDVASNPVSIHLPLSRFFAAIYLHLGTFGLTYDNIGPTMNLKRSPEEILEPILCAQTMIAQVHSGMWRRNGYSLLHQLYFYRNVRCRSEMLDRDIAGMQIGAALIESNQYLIHILNKFNLIDWIQPDYEAKFTASAADDEYIRVISMIDEFLELLIVVIGERYMPGISNISEEDRIKKEIIQLLCMKSYSHSELNRSLPDSNNETVLEDVIESVATFKKPQKSDAKGVYELKEELYEHYNMYFYHYTKEEKSKSEETQRLRRKNKNELVCCPPPKLPKLADGFIGIANLLQCDVMMTIMSTILDRAIDLKARAFQENHLQKVLHLIGYGIQEEQSGNYPFLEFYKCSLKYNLLPKLEELSHSSRVESHRDLILWTIQKFKEIQPKEQAEHETEAMQGDDSESAAPLTTAEKEKQEKESRARLAAERRAKILAQMQSAQKSFMTSNAEMFASSTAQSNSEGNKAMEWQDDEELAIAQYKTPACLGVDRRLHLPEEQNYKCILCFEDCTVTKDGPVLVYPAFLQKSKVLPSDQSAAKSSIFSSSCGHVMHANCWQEYYNTEEARERRTHRNRSYSASNSDFQCPYCRCLGNTVLLLTPPLSKYSMPNIIHAGDELFPIDLWIEVMKTFGDALNRTRTQEDETLLPDSLPVWDTILKDSNLVVDIEQFEKIAQPIQKPQLSTSWLEYVQHYRKSILRFLPHSAEGNEKETLIWLWQSCIYTIKSIEMYMRAMNKSLKNELSMRHRNCLSGLIRASCLYASNLSQNDVKNLFTTVCDLLDLVFKQKGDSVLEWNCFNQMVSTLLMVPNMLFATSPDKRIVPIGSMMDFYTLQVFFIANLVKAIVLYEAPESMETDEIEDEYFNEQLKDVPEKLKQNIAVFYCKYNLQVRRKAKEEFEKVKEAKMSTADDTDGNKENPIDDADDEKTNMSVENELEVMKCGAQCIGTLLEHVKMEMNEFLRCCCLFFHFVTDVDFPEEFSTASGATFENMCGYLGLTTNIAMYFDNESPYPAVLEMFAGHQDIVYYDFKTNKKRNGDSLNLIPCTQKIPKLVDLPEDYSDLINSVSDFICPKNEREEMKTPCMCLICGEILCGQSYCCQPELESRTVGACTFHAHFCGADIGLFLRIRDCQFIYLGQNKGCFVQPPYLDEYGETDQGLRRGNPLRLCPHRYNKVLMTWLGHGLHEEIARYNDSSAIGVTQWHHM